jgi:hypothetical protein
VILLPVGNSLNNQNTNAIADFDNKVDRKQVSVNSLKCNNINVNVNGLELSILPPFLGGGEVAATAANTNTDANSFANNGDGSQINDFRFICINNNNNTLTSSGKDTIPPTPPGPPEPATLIVKKQVLGCNFIIGGAGIPPVMECERLQNNSTGWLDCNNLLSFANAIFCQSLPENLFDIQVNASNTQQITQFEGSEEGITVPNLQPGTYVVNEIKHDSNVNQLGVDTNAEDACVNLAGFTDGGNLTTTSDVRYNNICIEYEDEQGSDCSEITLAAGEERTCIVKNYIRLAQDFSNF